MKNTSKVMNPEEAGMRYAAVVRMSDEDATSTTVRFFTQLHDAEAYVEAAVGTGNGYIYRICHVAE